MERVEAILFQGMSKFGRRKAVTRAALFTGRTGRPLRGTEDGTNGEDHPKTSPAGFDNPTDAVQEHGAYGGQGKAAWGTSPGGFAV
jgi:hypothetical protein